MREDWFHYCIIHNRGLRLWYLKHLNMVFNDHSFVCYWCHINLNLTFKSACIPCSVWCRKKERERAELRLLTNRNQRFFLISINFVNYHLYFLVSIFSFVCNQLYNIILKFCFIGENLDHKYHDNKFDIIEELFHFSREFFTLESKVCNWQHLTI